MDTPEDPASRPPSPLSPHAHASPHAHESSARAPPAPMIEAALCIDTIRRGVVDLATSERLDKESALNATRLFHAMEMLLRHECTERDKRIARITAELEHLRVSTELDRLANRSFAPDPVPTPKRARSKW